MTEYYICPDCGELTTSDRLSEDIAVGGLALCYCNYMKLQLSVEYQDFEPVCFREFVDWQEIPEKIYKGLEKQGNAVFDGMLLSNATYPDINKNSRGKIDGTRLPAFK